MADSQQNVVPTFSRLEDEDLARMEKSVVRASRRTPIGVIIPILTMDLLRTLKHTYLANARSFVRIYESHSEMNSLPKFDRHLELGLIEGFAAALDRAFAEFQDHLFGSPMIPEWRRIEVAIEGVLPELVQAFDQPSPAPAPAAAAAT